jgi:divalent metal cation (Fe/Co/Zn/Cd) transporter
VVGLLLTAGKFTAYAYSGSDALLTDALESLVQRVVTPKL